MPPRMGLWDFFGDRFSTNISCPWRLGMSRQRGSAALPYLSCNRLKTKQPKIPNTNIRGDIRRIESHRLRPGDGVGEGAGGGHGAGTAEIGQIDGLGINVRVIVVGGDDGVGVHAAKSVPPAGAVQVPGGFQAQA